MRDKTKQNKTKQNKNRWSFWREIGNWCRSVFIVDLSALKQINKF